MNDKHEVVSKHSIVASIVRAVLGAVLGFAAFKIALEISVYIVKLLVQLPIINLFMSYTPLILWLMVVLPTFCGCLAGSALCAWFFGNATPFGAILILRSVAWFIFLIISSALTWISGTHLFFCIASVVIIHQVNKDDL